MNAQEISSKVAEIQDLAKVAGINLAKAKHEYDLAINICDTTTMNLVNKYLTKAHVLATADFYESVPKENRLHEPKYNRITPLGIWFDVDYDNNEVCFNNPTSNFGNVNSICITWDRLVEDDI